MLLYADIDIRRLLRFSRWPPLFFDMAPDYSSHIDYYAFSPALIFAKIR